LSTIYSPDESELPRSKEGCLMFSIKMITAKGQGAGVY
jgi:hypothetical protein